MLPTVVGLPVFGHTRHFVQYTLHRFPGARGDGFAVGFFDTLHRLWPWQYRGIRYYAMFTGAGVNDTDIWVIDCHPLAFFGQKYNRQVVFSSMRLLAKRFCRC